MERRCEFQPLARYSHINLEIVSSVDYSTHHTQSLVLTVSIAYPSHRIVPLKSDPTLLHSVRLLTIFQDNYLDAYLDVIRETDPTKTALVFSCGMGAVRTTFAMVAASLVRRKQIMANGGPDPYASKAPQSTLPISSSPGTMSVSISVF